jgi:thioredoxin 1
MNKLFLVKFGTEWCNPCKAITPILDDIQIEYADKLSVINIDVDSDDDDLVTKYGIRSVPTILFIKNGEVFDKTVGSVTKEVLKDKIDVII